MTSFYFVDYCWSVGQKQQNPASESCLLPLVLGSFFGSSSEAAEILLPGYVCCLWTWVHSSGLRQRQQNPAPRAHLLPLTFGSFIGSMSEAAKSCFRGVFAAFGLGEFVRVNVRGSRNPVPKEKWLPLALTGFIEVIAEAAETQIQGHDSCLWLKRVRTMLYKEIISDLRLLTSAR